MRRTNTSRTALGFLSVILCACFLQCDEQSPISPSELRPVTSPVTPEIPTRKVPVIVSGVKGALILKCSWVSDSVRLDSDGIHLLPGVLPVGQSYTVTLSRQPEDSYCTVHDGWKAVNQEGRDTVSVRCRESRLVDFAPLIVGRSWIYHASYRFSQGPVGHENGYEAHWKRRYQVETAAKDGDDSTYIVVYEDFDLEGDSMFIKSEDLGLALEPRRFDCRESGGKITCDDSLLVCLGGIPGCREIHPFFPTRWIDPDSLHAAGGTECERELLGTANGSFEENVYKGSVGLIRSGGSRSSGAAGHRTSGIDLFRLAETDGRAFGQDDPVGPPCSYRIP